MGMFILQYSLSLKIFSHSFERVKLRTHHMTDWASEMLGLYKSLVDFE